MNITFHFPSNFLFLISCEWQSYLLKINTITIYFGNISHILPNNWNEFLKNHKAQIDKCIFQIFSFFKFSFLGMINKLFIYFFNIEDITIFNRYLHIIIRKANTLSSPSCSLYIRKKAIFCISFFI